MSLRDYAKIAPTKPGVYRFLDKDKRVLYVGKAKRLRARLASYFSGHVSDKTSLMLAKAHEIDIIVTRNEVEALLLENKLINQHKPPYNIQLKDTRRYAWILVTDEAYPRILTARNKRSKGMYFGPYTDGTTRRSIIVTLNKLFKLRTCNTLPKHVCLQYHIGNCTGPCAGHDTQHAYRERVEQAREVLKGNSAHVRKQLLAQMSAAAEREEYERAKEIRDSLRALKELEAKQVVEQTTSHDQAVIALTHQQDETLAVVLSVTCGVISKKQDYRLPRDATAEEFLCALYREQVPPKEVITEGIKSEESLEKFFFKKTGAHITITQPKRGEKKRLLELAQENTVSAGTEHHPALLQLKKHLRLSEPPATIDCFDVSTLHGTHTVAACVRYRAAKPDPSGYRRLQIQGAKHDDYAGIAEAVSRRYQEGDLPDLVVIDGGRGQLRAAYEQLPRGTPVVGLAKQHEEVFVPGRTHPLTIPSNDDGLLLLRRIRDATHRQAVRYHRNKRSQAMTASALDHVPGVGEKRKAALYKRFKTFDRIASASKDELQEVLGEKTGEAVYESLSR